MARLKISRFALALTTVALAGSTLFGAPPSEPQVRVAVSSDAITLLPVHLAQTLGYYQQEGLTVTLTTIGSASKTLDALHDGSANVALGTTVPIQMAAEGRSIQGFLVERGMPGYGAREIQGKLSLRASATAERILGENHPTPRGRRRGTVAVAGWKATGTRSPR